MAHNNKNKRELKAILFADVVGYTRLMQDNEEATHIATTELVDIFTKGCDKLGGEMLEIRGDGIFALFTSAINSVRFADKTQDLIEKHNQKYEDHRKIRFRIGIHLGDVVRNNKHYYGDSINIASRIEGLADPGGICISNSIYEQVKNNGDFGYEYLGLQRLKNITEPINIYRIIKDTNTAVLVASPRNSRKRGDSVSEEIRPSIAVLPFKNTSGDPNFEYFSDGISEDVIINLSKFHNLFVIARGSSFAYKNKDISAKRIGHELGVRYLADGTIRKTGSQVRISVQLVDTDTGGILWTEFYDRNLEYIFEIQDEISAIICNSTAVKIEKEERARITRLLPTNLHAYDCVLKGQQEISSYTRNGLTQAKKYYESALNYDPKYARALASISHTLNLEWLFSWANEHEDQTLQRALEIAREAVSLDEGDARGHASVGFVQLYQKQHELSMNAYQRARQLNPNDAEVMADMADALIHYGDPQKAIDLLKKAMHINPLYPDRYLWNMSSAYYNLKLYNMAIESIQKMNNPAQGSRILAASYAQLGEVGRAKHYAKEVLAAEPGFSLKRWQLVIPDKFSHDTEHYIEGLKKSGL